MYFVDREKIEETLIYLESQIHLFESKKEWTSPIEKAALERLTQMMLESVLDVGNAMIDGFIMRDPGSYDDIIDILVDEKVVSEETGNRLKTLIPFRKKLVQLYMEVDHHELQQQFFNQLPALKVFPKNVRDYLINELGPVSAFKN
ncbi:MULTISPECIES: DUF86 domain-containing protein [Neobacillus]|jgi:uncharacterized protein YutE (UPF0331/DUF86 family)|uniref:DUF86 domain-containing protein n=1 Tax=Neobacillus sedimentimangrovi TaxID=2699460 RepID=A0ABS8QL68_9BACI|nr:DUF86 domain-containing protein [Neobacillus sedimentimangrovi]AIM16072.1 hypothetical protein HW35_06980 [Bacillus sp. X1(2014)]MCD4840039.1 DUF86 domain-containing protein [Neobacillus sedimentimangrovi]